ncbi:MAG: RNA polymerase ECF-type sigma [Rhodospirillaceae bacterium]|nr:MAG: RNA polymerase ECF-type sigma [Rhodospirillaceae bacterium]TNC95601.1 MAG: RNA polymerase ECF-type sigma factor [Stygiobacter sp.]
MMIQRLTTSSSSAAALAGLDDETLLARMKDDDAAAYRLLVERHVDRAYAIALRVLGNVADAEDVAQECLVKVWTHRQSWQDGKARFSTWLYRVVVNRCIDLRRRPATECLDDVPEPMDDEADSVTRIHRTQVFGRLEQAMGKLPDQQRLALTLSYFDDLGNAEIAEIMSTTISAVESLLKRGRQTLRDRLRRSEHDCLQALAE